MNYYDESTTYVEPKPKDPNEAPVVLQAIFWIIAAVATGLVLWVLFWLAAVAVVFLVFWAIIIIIAALFLVFLIL